jgi:hypothetical protein
MRRMKFLAAAGAFVASAFSAGIASADYACSVSYYPGSTAFGHEGHVRVTVHAGPACTGTLMGNYALGTGGASLGNCSSNPVHRYERTGLLAMFGALQHAASVNQRITVSTTPTCFSGGTSCLAAVNFFSD